jgi:hypothetical protein
MIYTYDTKRAQLTNGCFKTGNGPTHVLILGSCRTMAFLNYLARWNNMSGDTLTISYINPFDWHWNANEELVDFEKAIDSLEKDERILSILRSADIFIHEHFGNYGMFNTSRDNPKNIYQFGMAAPTDISIPNFHDHFILYNDFVSFGTLPDDWVQRGEDAVDKFCLICTLSSFPEMADYFRNNWTKVRMFYTPNHTSKHFTMWLMRSMNDKFLHLPLTDSFWEQVSGEDMFASPCTDITDHDRQAYGLQY